MPPAPDSAQASVPEARLVCLDDALLPPERRGVVFRLIGPALTLGRGEDNDLVLPHAKVSRRHALLRCEDGAWSVQDQGSANGVSVNGRRVETARLTPGDTVSFGPLPFRFEPAEAPAPTPPVETPPPAAPPVVPATAGEAVKTGEAGEAEEAIEDKTLLFGDARASKAILEAQERAAAAAAPEAPEAEAQAETPEAETAAPVLPARPADRLAALLTRLRPYQTRRHALAAAGAVVLLLLAWHLVVALPRQRQEDMLHGHDKALREFRAASEVWSLRPDEAGHRAEIETLSGMLAAVTRDRERYPNLAGLMALEADLRLLILEREARLLLLAGQSAEAQARIDQVKERMTGLLGQAGRESGAPRKSLEDARALLDLLGLCVRYLAFARERPWPVTALPDGVPADVRRQAAELKDLMPAFVEIKKRENRALKIRFRYLDGMAEEADERALPLVDKWRRLSAG